MIEADDVYDENNRDRAYMAGDDPVSLRFSHAEET